MKTEWWVQAKDPGYFENRIPFKPKLGGAYVASQTTVLHMKRLNQTESPIFVFLCVFFFFFFFFFFFSDAVAQMYLAFISR